MINKLLPRFHALHTSFTDCFSSREEHPKPPHRNPVEQSLAEMLKTHPNATIYIDTCSLITDFGMAMLDAVETLFPRHRKKLMILSSVVHELQNLAKKTPSKAAACSTVLRKLNAMQAVSVVQSANPTFSDAGFLARFVSELEQTDIVLITQDQQLAEAASNLPGHLSGCIKKVHSVFVYRLSADGRLVPHCKKSQKVKGENNYDKQQHQSVQSSGEFRFPSAAVFCWSSADQTLLPAFRASHCAERPVFSWPDD